MPHNRLSILAASRASRAAAVLLGIAVAEGTFAACATWQASAPGASAGARDRPNDDDPAALVPAGLETIIDVDLAALRKSTWTASLLETPDPRARAAKAEAMGYDDLADVDRVIYAVTTAGGDAPTLVVAQGRLQSTRLADAFRTRWPAAVADHWRGVLVLVSGENALALLTDRTFASGPPAMVRAVVDRAFGVGPDWGADPALGPMRRALNPGGRESQPAVLATVTIDVGIRARVGDTVPLPRELRQVGLRLDVGQSMDLQALGILDDREAAAALARRLGISLADPVARLGLRMLGLEILLSQTTVTAEGARVLLRASVGGEQRSEVIAALRMLIGALRGGASAGAGG